MSYLYDSICGLTVNGTFCRVNYLQGDIIAGLTVGLTVIPQGLALAHVARLPPQVIYWSVILKFI